MAKQPSIKLNTGARIPQLGFGTWQLIPGPQTVQAVSAALEAGYRHIDTARIYLNERSVGKAIRDSGLPRSDIFVTTKLWSMDNNVPSAITKSLKRLGLDYVDLYLMHWPMKRRLENWKEMEKLVANGQAKAIGVSNFTIRHLTELMERTSIVPAVNQVEFHPFLYQKELLDFCHKHGIAVEAYSPLAHGQKLDDEQIVKIAEQHKASPAQVMIAWALQHDMIVIPKSKNPERIAQNLASSDVKLTSADIKVLDGLNENLRTCWDPTNIN